MSKVLKVFVNIILILFILVAAALFVPPLFGVSTVVSGSGMETNIQTGSVVYGISSRVESLEAGDKIVETGDHSAYVYEIASIDAASETASVTGAEGDTPQEITLRTTAQKVVVTVPLIGYVSIAMQTTQGRIVLGLAAALVIVLFIVAEVWSRRDDEDEEEDEEDADQFYARLAQEKKKSDEAEEKRFRKKQEKQEDEADPKQGAGTEEGWSKPRQETEMFIEKIEPEPVQEEEQPAAEQAVESSESPGDMADVQAALEAALVNQQMSSTGQQTEPAPAADSGESLKPDEIELAIPARSADDLLQEAYANGEDPKVEKDELTGVTFIDLSDCL